MQVWGHVNDAFIADTCDGPQHLFRVPMTLNVKPDRGRKEGYLLWFEPERRWTLDALEQAVMPWIGPEEEPAPAPVSVAVESDGEGVPYEQLPADIRTDIEGEHADNSAAMFQLIAKLVRAGHNESTIQASIAQGPAFRRKYGRRLEQEVDRCLRKITQSPWRIRSDDTVLLPIRKKVTSIPLQECISLPDAVAGKIDEYAKLAGVELQPWVKDAARFHEHVVANHRQGVLLAPCGAGKSTWALSHMAVHAEAGTRFLYVVETVRQLYQAADKLKQLTDEPVGRVHAFNAEKCKELCGKEHEWMECGAGNPQSVCHTCPANSECAFYGRAQEEAKPILVMTHAGLVRLIESGSPLLTDARMIVDEDLDVFADWEVSLADLRLVQAYNENPLPWEALFPYSRATGLLDGWEIDANGRSFAARNYTYRDFASVPGLQALDSDLRRMLATDLQPNNMFQERAGDRDRARDVLAMLVNLLRPSLQGDAAYSYVERQDEHGNSIYRVRKQRFSLGTNQPWASMWILNASAMLTPVEYPPNLPVFTCPDLPDASHLLRLHVVVASPTRKALEPKLLLTEVAQRFSTSRGVHRRVLIASAKDEQGLTETKDTMEKLWPPDSPPVITGMTRGRIKGSNEAGDCTLAILTPMPLFTTVDDYVLQAALLLKRNVPRSAIFHPNTEMLRFPGGHFAMPAVQECYALGALDELYQATWRAAVRNGKRTEVVMALLDVTWMIALWQTVMPKAEVVTAYRLAGPAEAKNTREEHRALWEQAKDAPNLPPEAVEAIATQRALLDAATPAPFFVTDRQITGIQHVIGMPANTTLRKGELADRLGFGGANPWKENKARILSLVTPWLEESPDDGEVMVRRI